MSSKHGPADCLADILDNIARIERYIFGLDHEQFEADERTRDAVERCIERICEAAFGLGDRAATLMPGQPWGDIRGMGNRFRHAYDNVDLDIVWLAVQNRVPSLKADAERALDALRSERPPPKGDPA